MQVWEAQRAQALFDCRLAVRTAQASEERLRELGVDQLRSPKLSGMPGGRGGVPGGLDGRIARIEAMRHQAAQDREAAERAKVHAERYLKGMTGARLHFCRAYYLGGMTLLQAAEMADRSTRQCERYRRDIYGRRDADGLLGDDEDDTLPPPGEMPECAG